MNQKAPDWRTDPDVLAINAEIKPLEARSAELERATKAAIRALRAEESAQRQVENDWLRQQAKIADVVDAKDRVKSARQSLDESQAAADQADKALAEAQRKQQAVHQKAQEAVNLAFKALYVEATDELEASLERAVSADERVNQLYLALASQFPQTSFPAGFGNARWPARRLDRDSLAFWRRWRAECSALSPKAKAKATAQELQRIGEKIGVAQ